MSTATPPAPWTDVLALDDLAPGALKAVSVDGQALLLVRDAGGGVHALDARCPHEGYPLATGDLDGCTLTCSWHNWKFDVRDGSCLLGGEGVTRHPVRVSDGRIQVDPSGPDPREAVPGLLASLHEGVARHENGRAVRDGVRLLLAGVAPERLLLELARHDARHAEYGTSHGLAVAADCARVLPRLPGPRAMLAIAPVIDLVGEATVRQPAHADATPRADADEAALLDAVEREDMDAALGLLAGAFASGRTRAQVEGWLFAVAAEHFTDFGHQLIYLTKAAQLLEHGEGDDAAVIHAGLVRGFVYATREDTLPYWGRYTRRVQALRPEFARVDAGARDDATLDGRALRAAVLDGSHDEALDAVWNALTDGVSAERVARELVVAAAERLLRFDVPLDSDESVSENWLWCSHRFTFAAAARQAVERWRDPRRLLFLFQTLAFTHSGAPMDAPAARRSDLTASTPDLDAFAAALSARRTQDAVAHAAALLHTDDDAAALGRLLEDVCLEDPLVRPIAVAHALKTTWAALEERAVLADHPRRDVPVLAAVRMLASPLVERRVAELVRSSIAWVAEGRMPRKLTQGGG